MWHNVSSDINEMNSTYRDMGFYVFDMLIGKTAFFPISLRDYGSLSGYGIIGWTRID